MMEFRGFFLVVCLAFMFTCIKTFLETKLWEDRHVFGKMVVVVGSLTSSSPHRGPVVESCVSRPSCASLPGTG